MRGMPVGPDELRRLATDFLGGDDEGFVDAVLRRLATRQASAGKTCASCGIEKPLSAFGRDSRNRDGLHRVCRLCRSEQMSQVRLIT